ncbi:MAG: hypothetical protein EZS28_006863 [Streblomastix strix]|uniref:Uncharacterized protein n=1 Tax=Streblomastix strix TaxID=222440 RepID=A0A5J4WSV1_9EUKA|nr:MAG: hypothetical protein EZS28_006863 [Streblomastix strix]
MRRYWIQKRKRNKAVVAAVAVIARKYEKIGQGKETRKFREPMEMRTGQRMMNAINKLRKRNRSNFKEIHFTIPSTTLTSTGRNISKTKNNFPPETHEDIKKKNPNENNRNYNNIFEIWANHLKGSYIPGLLNVNYGVVGFINIHSQIYQSIIDEVRCLFILAAEQIIESETESKDQEQLMNELERIEADGTNDNGDDDQSEQVIEPKHFTI